MTDCIVVGYLIYTDLIRASLFLLALFSHLFTRTKTCVYKFDIRTSGGCYTDYNNPEHNENVHRLSKTINKLICLHDSKILIGATSYRHRYNYAVGTTYECELQHKNSAFSPLGLPLGDPVRYHQRCPI